MYKVFIQDQPVFFISEPEISDYDGVFVRLERALDDRKYFLRLAVSLPQETALYIVCEEPSEGIAAFFSDYDAVEAAGGIVRRKDKYLFIKRNGVWDLPKGKMEDGEDVRSAACREIEEECGIEAPEAGELILITYHTYDYKGTPTIKKTYWFEMSYEGKAKGAPQIEEGITKVSWKKKDQLGKVLDTTYASIRDVIQCYFGL